MIRLIVLLLGGLVVLAHTSEHIFAGQNGDSAHVQPTVKPKAATVENTDLELNRRQRDDGLAETGQVPMTYAGRVASETAVPFGSPMIVNASGILTDVN